MDKAELVEFKIDRMHRKCDDSCPSEYKWVNGKGFLTEEQWLEHEALELYNEYLELISK